MRTSTMHDNAVRRRWPRNADGPKLVQSLTGLTLSALWRMKDASGALVDDIGGGNLAAVGTPTYLVAVGDRVGVHYDANTDGHRSDVLALGTSSAVLLTSFIPPPAQGTYNGIIGRITQGAVRGCYAYVRNNANVVDVTFADGTLTTTVPTTADVRTPQVPILLGIQIDRVANLGRVRVARRGALLEAAQASIAGHGTYTGGTQTFGAGGYWPEASVFGGCKVSWVAAALGAQCEGSDVLQNVFRRLKFE